MLLGLREAVDTGALSRLVYECFDEPWCFQYDTRSLTFHYIGPPRSPTGGR